MMEMMETEVLPALVDVSAGSPASFVGLVREGASWTPRHARRHVCHCNPGMHASSFRESSAAQARRHSAPAHLPSCLPQELGAEAEELVMAAERMEAAKNKAKLV